jgi:hypothetical protein
VKGSYNTVLRQQNNILQYNIFTPQYDSAVRASDAIDPRCNNPGPFSPPAVAWHQTACGSASCETRIRLRVVHVLAHRWRSYRVPQPYTALSTERIFTVSETSSRVSHSFSGQGPSSLVWRFWFPALFHGLGESPVPASSIVMSLPSSYWSSCFPPTRRTIFMGLTCNVSLFQLRKCIFHVFFICLHIL